MIDRSQNTSPERLSRINETELMNQDGSPVSVNMKVKLGICGEIYPEEHLMLIDTGNRSSDLINYELFIKYFPNIAISGVSNSIQMAEEGAALNVVGEADVPISIHMENIKEPFLTKFKIVRGLANPILLSAKSIRFL